MMLTIYSKEGCPYCDKFIQVCELENLPHVVYKLDKEFTLHVSAEKVETAEEESTEE